MSSEEFGVRETYKILKSDLDILQEIESNLSIQVSIDTVLHGHSSAVVKFKRIAELGFEGLNARDVIRFVGKLSSLQKLRCRNCSLDSFPIIDSLTSLEILDLSINHLSGNFSINSPQLLSLNLNNNQLRRLIIDAPLKVLSISDNIIDEFPELPPSIEALDLRKNKISVLPEDLSLIFPNLKILNLDGNSLTSLPRFPDTLESLTLSRNQLKGEIRIEAPGLKRLEINANQIEQIVELPANLTFLSAQSNNITEIDLRKSPLIEKLMLDSGVTLLK